MPVPEPNLIDLRDRAVASLQNLFDRSVNDQTDYQLQVERLGRELRETRERLKNCRVLLDANQKVISEKAAAIGRYREALSIALPALSKISAANPWWFTFGCCKIAETAANEALDIIDPPLEGDER